MRPWCPVVRAAASRSIGDRLRLSPTISSLALGCRPASVPNAAISSGTWRRANTDPTYSTVGASARGLDAAVVDEVAEPGDEDPRLPRSGRGNDPGWPDVVGDGLHLVGREVCRWCGPVGHQRHAPQLYRLVVDDRLGHRQRLARSPIDPHGRAFREDISRTSRGDPRQCGGLGGPPPLQFAGAGVVGVVPHDLDQSLVEEGEPLVQLVGSDANGLGRVELHRRVELDDRRDSLVITTLQVVDEVGQLRRV